MISFVTYLCSCRGTIELLNLQKGLVILTRINGNFGTIHFFDTA